MRYNINKVIKALEDCLHGIDCTYCPYNKKCYKALFRDIVHILKQQQTELKKSYKTQNKLFK